MLKDNVKVITESELNARYHVMCEKYAKDMIIEAKTLLQLVKQTVIPAVFKYRRDLSAGVAALMSVMPEDSLSLPEKRSIAKLGTLAEALETSIDRLEGEVVRVEAIEDAEKQSNAAVAIADMLNEVRGHADAIEAILADEYYPLPKYTEMLFN